jgi:charged multivesicular body protein 6
MGGYSSKPKPDANVAVAVEQPKRKIQITSVDRAILDLKNARDKLHQYRIRLLIDDEKLMNKIKIAKQKNQISYALQLLKLHHYKQQQYENCNQQLLNILQMVQTIDSTQNDLSIINAMKVGKESLQQLQNEISLDNLIQLMDDINEQHQTEQEINDILQQNIPQFIDTTLQIDTSDEALLAELEALQRIDSDTSTTEPTATATTNDISSLHLPTVPTHKLPDIVQTTTITPGKIATTTTTTKPEERVAVLG